MLFCILCCGCKLKEHSLNEQGDSYIADSVALKCIASVVCHFCAILLCLGFVFVKQTSVSRAQSEFYAPQQHARQQWSLSGCRARSSSISYLHCGVLSLETQTLNHSVVYSSQSHPWCNVQARLFSMTMVALSNDFGLWPLHETSLWTYRLYQQTVVVHVPLTRKRQKQIWKIKSKPMEPKVVCWFHLFGVALA